MRLSKFVLLLTVLGLFVPAIAGAANRGSRTTRTSLAGLAQKIRANTAEWRRLRENPNRYQQSEFDVEIENLGRAAMDHPGQLLRAKLAARLPAVLLWKNAVLNRRVVVRTHR